MKGTVRYVLRYMLSREMLRLFRQVVTGRW